MPFTLQTRTVFSSRIDHELPQAVPAVNRMDWDSVVLLKKYNSGRSSARLGGQKQDHRLVLCSEAAWSVLLLLSEPCLYTDLCTSAPALRGCSGFLLFLRCLSSVIVETVHFILSTWSCSNPMTSLPPSCQAACQDCCSRLLALGRVLPMLR